MIETGTLIRRGLKLSHLRLVAALAETGQVGAAADYLGMTQPAASRLLGEVEQICQEPIHERSGRGVRLTAQGQALARRAARVLLELDGADRDIREVSDGMVGHVRIGAVTGPALDYVLPAVRAARLELPDVTVEVEVGPSDLLADLLVSGRIDFSVSRVPDGMQPELVAAHILAPEPVSLVVRAGHRLLGMADITPADLMDHDWVMPGPGAILRRSVERRLTDLGLPLPRVRLATSSFLLTLSLIQQSNAIAPLARAVARQFAGSERAQARILPIDLGFEVPSFSLLTLAGSHLTPAAERLRGLVLLQHRP